MLKFIFVFAIAYIFGFATAAVLAAAKEER